ncbi:MAG: DNA-packaging protein, partial [Acidobacteriaceae bacterium]|nr:DNA-packaging protein [Acidobacteriaceae bacterium]
MTFTREQLMALSKEDLLFLDWQARWRATARPDQMLPETGWSQIGVQAGRGYGKTRVGAEWLGQKAYRDTNKFPFRVIAPTLNDVRFTCFEGQSGLLTVIPPELVADYNKTNLQITLINGATIRGFGAEEPERLRGPNSAGDWCDELAAWTRDEDTWDQAAFGRRLGVNPQVVWTSTPKPKTLIRKLTEPKEGRVIIRGSTYDNRENLAESFFDELKKYEGTKLGRQELEGELIDAEEGGIIARSWFKL